MKRSPIATSLWLIFFAVQAMLAQAPTGTVAGTATDPSGSVIPKAQITRIQSESLPLNGRSFFELARLEPGVQAPVRQSNNRILVPVMGGAGGNFGGQQTRVTVDGGSIMALGIRDGAAMGFSQDVVQ